MNYWNKRELRDQERINRIGFVGDILFLARI